MTDRDEIGGVDGHLRLWPVLAGSGMLLCVRDHAWTYDGELECLMAGHSRVARDHELARVNPHLFEPADPSDAETARKHEELAGGVPVDASKPRQRLAIPRAFVLRALAAIRNLWSVGEVARRASGAPPPVAQLGGQAPADPDLN